MLVEIALRTASLSERPVPQSESIQRVSGDGRLSAGPTSGIADVRVADGRRDGPETRFRGYSLQTLHLGESQRALAANAHSAQPDSLQIEADVLRPDHGRSLLRDCAPVDYDPIPEYVQAHREEEEEQRPRLPKDFEEKVVKHRKWVMFRSLVLCRLVINILYYFSLILNQFSCSPSVCPSPIYIHPNDNN